MAFDRTKTLVGTATKVYVNSKLVPYTSKISYKMTGDFDDAAVMGEYGTHKIYLGYGGEGTLTEYKTASTLIRTIVESLQTGVIPDIEIIVDIENKHTKENEPVKLKEVVFSEAGYDIETKSTISEELPFSFADIEYLNTIKE